MTNIGAPQDSVKMNRVCRSRTALRCSRAKSCAKTYEEASAHANFFLNCRDSIKGSLKDSSLTLGRACLHHKSLLLPTDWMHIYIEVGIMQSEVVNQSWEQRQTGQKHLGPEPDTSPSPGCGTGWIRLIHARELRNICPRDLKGLPLIVPKEEISATRSSWQRKTESNLGPSWVDELPATFHSPFKRIIHPLTVGFWSTLISFPPRWALHLDGPGEAICTGKEGRRRKVCLTAGIHARAVGIKRMRNALDAKLEDTQLNNWKLSELLQHDRE